MKFEIPKSKLPNFLKPEKQKEFSQLDYAYITTKYYQIQESNDRLQKLITKFTIDPERRLHSVHESVICQSNLIKETRDKSAPVKKDSAKKKKHIEQIKLAVVEEAVGHKIRRSGFVIPQIKTENEVGNKPPLISSKTGKPKNFLYINRKDAFDPHGLAGKNAQLGKSLEKEEGAKDRHETKGN